MRKKLLLLAVSLLGMASAQAQTLAVTGNKFEVLKGKSATLTVNVNSATDVRDVQFDITLPTGVTLGEVGVDANSNYSVAISDPTGVTGGNKYTVILYSATGQKGATAINFPVTADANFSGELWADLTSGTAEGKYTVDTAVEADASSTDYSFQIGLLGDANKSGGVNIADVSTIISAVVGGTPEKYSELAANANETGGVNIADVSAVIGIITGAGAGE